MNIITMERKTGDYGFEATDAYGHAVRMDTSPDHGGDNFGVRPMQMLLMGLAGCSAIDVISILKKQRQQVKDYKMVVKGEREAGKEPSLWKDIELEFHIYGDVDEDKAKRAVQLSMEKYCSVSATLTRGGTGITWNTFVYKQ